MRRILMVLAIFLVIALLSGCGGGTFSGSSGSSRVTITVGDNGQTVSLRIGNDTFLARVHLLLRGLLSAGSAQAAIPSNVTLIRFTISAPDMAPIKTVVAVAGQSSLTETFIVPNGSSRRFLVEAEDGSKTIQFRGETFSNLDGSPVTLTVTMNDVVPPTFAGVQSATAVSPSEIDVTWNQATDNYTPSTSILYHGYVTRTPGGEQFDSPSFTTTPGQTSYRVTGLTANTTYYVVVRADDRNGNIEQNTNEKAAATFEPTPPTVISVNPPNGAANVLSQPVTVTFSEPMLTTTITATSFSLSHPCEGSTVCTEPAAVTYSSDKTAATLTPLNPLLSLSRYTVSVTTDVTDLAGNHMVQPFTSLFTTGDVTPPSVTSVSVVNTPLNNLTSAEITINFSEPMDASSLVTPGNYDGIYCSGDCAPKVNLTAPTPNANNTSVTFTADSAYYCYMTFVLTVKASVKDAAGNPMTNDYTWTYKTDCPRDPE